MYVFEKGPYKICRIFMTIAGIWPFSNSSLKIAIRMVIMIIGTSFVFSQMVALYIHGCTVINVISFTGFGCIIALCFTKYFSHILLQNKIKLILRWIAYEWEMFADKKELEILEDYGKRQRRLVLICVSILQSSFCVYGGSSFWPYFLGMIIPSNTSHHPSLRVTVEYSTELNEHFYLIYAHFICAFASLISIALGVESLNILMAYHYCAMFQIICYRMHSAIDDVSGCTSIEICDKTYRKICTAMQIHAHVTCMFNFIMDFLSIMQFIVVVLVVFSSTFYLLRLSLTLYSDEDSDMLLLNVFLVFVHFSYSFLQNHIGQIFIDHSLKVFNEIYNTKWYAQPLRVQKLLLMGLLRTSKTCVPVMGGIYVPSMEGFAMMINTSLSYFAVIHSIKYNP